MRAEATEITWTPPGPGSWTCERSHTSPGPTPVYRRMVSDHTEPTYREGMKRYGGAIGSIDLKFVNGAMYRRIVPLVAPDRDTGKVPPNAVLWLLTRLHPEFRRREKRAAKVLADQTFLDEIRAWAFTERYEWIEQNRALQAVDPEQLTDDELAAHVRTLGDVLIAGWIRHHELHASDLGPIGDLLAHAVGWNLDTTTLMTLLCGSSPATTSTARHGTTIAEALRAGGVDPETVTTLDEIRSVPAASDSLDDYLGMFGWRLISDYDIEGLTLNEIPSAVVAIVRIAGAAPDKEMSQLPTNGTGSPPLAELERSFRDQAGDPALFDELLAAARQAYGVRDDNGPLTWAWPAGLTRRAYLEAGRRLVAQDRIATADHVFELDIDELAAILDDEALPSGGELPSAAALADRAAHRAWERNLDAPDALGPPLAEPDLAPLPPAIRRVMGIILAAVTMLDPPDTDPADTDPADTDPAAASGEKRLPGLGIGTARYRGVARVVDDAATAIKNLNPGEVLVTAWTAPSFNAVLAIAGGVVVQEGGLLCHAAVMARELGIPAVVGCADAMTAIGDGDLVEVDPTAGLVTVLEPSAGAGSVQELAQ